eukprot:358032-Chlamydomonas_euryale.AAC.4
MQDDLESSYTTRTSSKCPHPQPNFSAPHHSIAPPLRNPPPQPAPHLLNPRLIRARTPAAFVRQLLHQRIVLSPELRTLLARSLQLAVKLARLLIHELDLVGEHGGEEGMMAWKEGRGGAEGVAE